MTAEESALQKIKWHIFTFIILRFSAQWGKYLGIGESFSDAGEIPKCTVFIYAASGRSEL